MMCPQEPSASDDGNEQRLQNMWGLLVDEMVD